MISTTNTSSECQSGFEFLIRPYLQSRFENFPFACLSLFAFVVFPSRKTSGSYTRLISFHAPLERRHRFHTGVVYQNSKFPRELYETRMSSAYGSWRNKLRVSWKSSAGILHCNTARCTRSNNKILNTCGSFQTLADNAFCTP